MIPYCIMVIEDEDDRAFMEQLYLSYRRLMYSEIFKITQDTWDTEDIMQSVLEKLIDIISELRTKDRDHLVNYIIAACRNRTCNYLRDSGRNRMVEYDDCESVGYNGLNQMDLALIKKEERERLSKAWPKLDERSRHVLEGYYILEKPMSELGEELGIKPDSVRMILARARKKAYIVLKKELGW